MLAPRTGGNITLCGLRLQPASPYLPLMRMHFWCTHATYTYTPRPPHPPPLPRQGAFPRHIHAASSAFHARFLDSRLILLQQRSKP